MSGRRPGPAPRARDRALVRELLRWFDRSARDLPWRRRRTPYRVWVSEVMLQQTTAEVVARRFEGFVLRFPDVAALARAPLAAVLGAWAGLGYYRRARALHEAARVCAREHGGRLPGSFEALRALPGVGDYTAGAVASLGFGSAVPAVDGNVARVWSRFEGMHARPRTIADAIRRWIPARAGGRFNEALIELGATLCRPVAPRCGECPLRPGCLAAARGAVDRYPAPRARKGSVAVTAARGILRDPRGRVLLVRRPRGASLLGGFLELPGRWLAAGEDPGRAVADVFEGLGFSEVRVGARVAEARHVITHHRIRSVAFEVSAAPRTPPARIRFYPGSRLTSEGVTTETRKLALREVVAP